MNGELSSWDEARVAEEWVMGVISSPYCSCRVKCHAFAGVFLDHWVDGGL